MNYCENLCAIITNCHNKIYGLGLLSRDREGDEGYRETGLEEILIYRGKVGVSQI